MACPFAYFAKSGRHRRRSSSVGSGISTGAKSTESLTDEPIGTAMMAWRLGHVVSTRVAG